MLSKCHLHVYTLRPNDNPLKAGYFAHEDAKGDYEIYDLDGEDENYLQAFYVPEDEAIFRADTSTTRRVQPGMQFLLKINFSNLLVYFNDPKASDAGKVMFSTKGSQIVHLFVTKQYCDKIMVSKEAQHYHGQNKS